MSTLRQDLEASETLRKSTRRALVLVTLRIRKKVVAYKKRRHDRTWSSLFYELDMELSFDEYS